MEGLNKIISLILGLVVVVILFAIITGRINLKGKNILKLGSQTVTTTPAVSVTPKPTQTKNNGGFFGLFKKPTQTPTVTPVPTGKMVTINTTKESDGTYHSYVAPTQSKGVTITFTPNNSQMKNVSTIPSTGSESLLLLPFMGSSLLAGIYLKKKK
jgi:LPXTG-motif cell wall-anchored protein